MRKRQRRLRPGDIGVIWPLDEIDQVATRLIDPGPIPGLARGNVFLADVDRLAARLDLPLRPVKHDIDTIFPIQQLHLVKLVALVADIFGEAEQLAVAVEFSLPAGRQVALEASAIEAGRGEQRLVGHRHSAAIGAGAEQAAIVARDISKFEMSGVERAEQPAIGVRAEAAHPGRLGLAFVIGRDLGVV